MDYRTLLYIVTVAEEKNISKAAEKLHISQPSLSSRILNQEHRIGVPLFDRTTHPLQLTYAGERYILAAQHILSMKEQLEKEMEDIANTRKGRILLGATKSRSIYLLPQVVPRFKELHPQVEITLVEEISTVLESLLVTGKIELGVLLMPVQNEHLEYRHLYDEEILLCLPGGHPLIARYEKQGVDLRLMKDEPFILYKKEMRLRKIADILFAEAGFSPRIALESHTSETILPFVSAGMGSAILPKSVMQFSAIYPKPACFTLGDPPMASSFAFAWRRNTYVGWVAREFMKLTRAILSCGAGDFDDDKETIPGREPPPVR